MTARKLSLKLNVPIYRSLFVAKFAAPHDVLERRYYFNDVLIENWLEDIKIGYTYVQTHIQTRAHPMT